MSLDYLSDTIELPFDRAAFLSGDPQRVADALWKIVRTLQAERLKNIHVVVNNMIGLSQTQYHYYSLPDPNTGAYPDGTWRTGVVDDEFVIQKYTSGTWVTVAGFGA